MGTGIKYVGDRLLTNKPVIGAFPLSMQRPAVDYRPPGQTMPMVLARRRPRIGSADNMCTRQVQEQRLFLSPQFRHNNPPSGRPSTSSGAHVKTELTQPVRVGERTSMPKSGDPALFNRPRPTSPGHSQQTRPRRRRLLLPATATAIGMLHWLLPHVPTPAPVTPMPPPSRWSSSR